MVTAGFYRVHLWVLMGLNTFASLALYTMANTAVLKAAFGVAVALTLLSYVGAVVWLYEKAKPGIVALLLVMAGGLAGALLATNWENFAQPWLAVADVVASGLLMGAVMTAMLLGHWYLSTPNMQLKPLQNLVAFSSAAVGVRCLVCLAGMAGFLMLGTLAETSFLFWVFVAFRWLAGLLGVAMLVYMTQETLKVPNTQSATGILYAAIILVFLGELVGQMLSADASFPL